MLLLGAGALVLLASPRHRAFYFGEPEGGAAPGSLPRPPFVRRTSPAPPAPPALPVRGVRIPAPDAEGRVRIPVADQVPRKLPADGVPAGWELKEFAGQASVELERSDGRVALKLRSERTAFALYRDVVLDVREFPFLEWSWKVTRLPVSGDGRDPGRNDQAAQVYVIFPRWPAPVTASEVIGYVWDTRAPIGTRMRIPRAPNVRMIVVESGTANLDAWQRQRRNVAEDYAALFGGRPPRVGKVAVMTDSDDTGGLTEAFFGPLTFSRTTVQSTEIPTSMLR